MEKLSGVPLTDLDAIRSITRADPTEVLVNALNTWFGTVMGASSFHADVHAGGAPMRLFCDLFLSTDLKSVSSSGLSQQLL